MTQHDPEKSNEESDLEQHRDKGLSAKQQTDEYIKLLGLEEERKDTRLSEERTQLSLERTFLSWLRTGIAAELAGLAIAKFITFNQYPSLPEIVGVIIILTGMAFYGISLWMYYTDYKRGKKTRFPLPSSWVMIAIIIALLLSAVISLYMSIV